MDNDATAGCKTFPTMAELVRDIAAYRAQNPGVRVRVDVSPEYCQAYTALWELTDLRQMSPGSHIARGLLGADDWYVNLSIPAACVVIGNQE